MGYGVEPVVSDLRQLEYMNFLERNFSKLPLLYETINTFRVVIFVLIIISGLLGETWVVLGVFLP